MRPLIVAVTAAILTTAGLIAAPPATASCMAPRPAVFPAGGALPPHPTIYRFEPGAQPATTLRVEGPDGPVRFTTRDVSTTEDIRVTAIRIDATEGPITIQGHDYERVYRYDLIAQAAPAAPLEAPVAARVAREQSAWTCSHTDGIAIEGMAPGVVAVRARWSNGAEAIVTPDTDAYFAWPDAPPAAGALRVFLGHPSCTGNQIPTRYIGRRDFTLFAIYADGGSHEIVLPRGLATVAVEPDEPDHDDELSSIPLPAPPRDPTRLALTGVAIAALTFALVLVRVRRRRRGTHVAP